MNKKLFITRRNFIRAGLLGLFFLTGAKGYINSRSLRLTRHSVGLERLPHALDGLKIGQITDIHAGPLVSREQIRKGVDMIMTNQPDLIVLTGDFVSGATKFLRTSYGGFREHHYEYCMKELGRLKAPLGVFAVLGNHDFWSGPEVTLKILNGLEKIGVRVLRNRAVPLEKEGHRLYLAGVDDYWEGSFSLTKALKDIPADACTILLSHNPDVNESIEAMGEYIDLVISGHTHGGQVVLPFLGALYIPSPFGQKYLAGLVRDGKRQTYTSRGLGLFLVPVRINCPADVTLLTLVRE